MNDVAQRATLDPITFEVVKNALSSTADEMALIIMRSAYSPVVRDSMDYSTALCDRHGQVIAQGLTLAVQLGSFPDCMRILVREHASTARPGDMHTRLYGTTMLSTLLPPWVFAEGINGVRRNLTDALARAEIKQFAGLISSLKDWSKVQLLDLPGRPDISRLTLAEIGRRRNRDPHDCALDILLDEVENLHRPM